MTNKYSSTYLIYIKLNKTLITLIQNLVAFNLFFGLLVYRNNKIDIDSDTQLDNWYNNGYFHDKNTFYYKQHDDFSVSAIEYNKQLILLKVLCEKLCVLWRYVILMLI